MCETRRGAEALLEPRSSAANKPGAPSRLRLAIFALRLLQLIAWTLSLSAVALAAKAHVWTLQQFESYSWTHSTVDAAVGAVALSVVSTAAQRCGAVLAQLVLGVALGVVLLVKRSMLQAVESTAVAVVTVAAVSPWIWALAALVHRRHRSLATRLKLTSVAEQLEGVEAPQRKSRGATIGRLLGLARPEYPLLVLATVALFLSAASQMAMPHVRPTQPRAPPGQAVRHWCRVQGAWYRVQSARRGCHARVPGCARPAVLSLRRARQFIGVLISAVEVSGGTQAQKQAQLQQVPLRHTLITLHPFITPPAPLPTPASPSEGSSPSCAASSSLWQESGWWRASGGSSSCTCSTRTLHSTTATRRES